MGLGDVLGDIAGGLRDVLTTPGNLPAILRGVGVGVGAANGFSPQLGVQFPSLPEILEPLPDMPGFDVGGQGACAGFRRSAAAPWRPVRELRAVHPVTGKIHSWTHRGSPVYYTGDRAIAKGYARHAGFKLMRRGSSSRRVRRRR